MYIISILIGLIIIFFISALLIYVKVFNKRIDPCPLIKYFNPDDFSMNTELIEITNENDKYILRGYIYNKEKKDEGIVVFCHGLCAGQIEYTTEINYFCNLGFIVIALDNVGCNYSDGKNIRGMYCGIESVISAVNYIKKNKKFNGMKIHIIGHSLGGYSALCASSIIDCDTVVSINSPLTPSSSLYCGVSAYINKYFTYILQPFWYMIDFLNFGIKGNMNSSKCAMKSRAKKLLIIHGEFDKNVPLKYSAYGNLSENMKIKKFLAKNKCHKPYVSIMAQMYLNEFQRTVSQSLKNGVEIDDDFFESFDFEAASEEDEDVMKVISNFLFNY